MKLRTAKDLDRFAKWAAILADIGVILSIGFALYTYFDQKREKEVRERTEATELAASKRGDTALRLVTLRHQPPYADVSQQLTNALLANGRLKVFWAGGQKDFIASDADMVIKEVGAGKIDGLASYYSTVIDCQSEGNCDAKIVDNVLKDDIRFFWCSTHHYILPEIGYRMQAPRRYDKLAHYAARLKFDCKAS